MLVDPSQVSFTEYGQNAPGLDPEAIHASLS